MYYNFYWISERSPRPALGFKNLRKGSLAKTHKFLNDPAIEAIQ